MSLQTEYNKFVEKIRLTRESDKYREAREKDDIIVDKVKSRLKEKGYEVKCTFIQGSLKTHTAIIPLDGDYDIDRAIAISHESSNADPVVIKKIIRDVLKEHGFKDPKIKKPCVTADYKGKPIHIDFPLYRVDEDDNYQLGVGKEFSTLENKYWDDSDPKGLIDWITSSDNIYYGSTLTNAERNQFYRIVKYLKRWRDNIYSSNTKRKKVFSIGLTIMIKECFYPSVDSEGNVSDHDSLKQTIRNILNETYFKKLFGEDKYDIQVYLPVTPTDRDVFLDCSKDVGTDLKKKLEKLLGILEDADNKSTVKEKCELLQKQFGDDFPIPKEDNKSSSSSMYQSNSPGYVGVSNGA